MVVSDFNSIYSIITEGLFTKNKVDPNVTKILTTMQTLNNTIDPNVVKVLEYMQKSNDSSPSFDQIKQILQYMYKINNSPVSKATSQRDSRKSLFNLLDFIKRHSEYAQGRGENGFSLLLKAVQSDEGQKRLNALHGLSDYMKAKQPILIMGKSSLINNITKALKESEK